SQRSKTYLSVRRLVRVAVVAGRLKVEQDQQRVEVSLEQNIDVNPLRQVASVSDVSLSPVKLLSRCRGGSVLNRKPLGERRHVVDTRMQRPHLAIDFLGTKRRVEPHELRDIRSGCTARKIAPEKSAGCHGAARLRAVEVGHARQIRG